MTFQPGDEVTWMHEARGGYGYVLETPATVVKMTAKRVTIDALMIDGDTRRISVKPESLKAVQS